MRFLILTAAFSPDGSRADMLQQLAEELATRGHRVDVISMGMDGNRPAGPCPTDVPGLRAFVLGVPPAWAPHRGALKYAPNVWRLNLNRSLDRWLTGPYDGFLFFTPGVMSAGVGQRLRRMGVVRRTGFLLWDFFPVAVSEAGALALGPAERTAFGLERRIAAASDVLLAMSPAGADFAKAYYGLPTAHTAILPPWGRPVTMPGPQPPKYERFTCVWGGQFIGLRAIPDILEAARILESQGVPVDFRLAGDGPLLEETRQRVRALGLESVHFEGRLTHDRYLDVLRRSHVGLSVIEPVSSPCFPSKTVDYCQVGLAMVASVEQSSDYGQIIADAGFGVAVAAGDAPGIAESIRRLADSPQAELDGMAGASRRFFEEHLDVAVAATRIEQVMSSPV